MDIMSWLKIASSIVGAFSVISTVTPNRADNVVADVLCRVVNFVGMNFGKSRNEVS